MSAKRKLEILSETAIGGLRRPFRALMGLPRVRQTGLQIRHIVMDIFSSSPKLLEDSLMAIGSETHPGPDEKGLSLIRDAMASQLHAKSCEPVIGDKVATEVRADIIDAWVSATDDPETEVPIWLRQGAPGGVRHQAQEQISNSVPPQWSQK